MHETKRFVDGEFYAEAYDTSAGPYQLAALVAVEGERLVLHDFSLAPLLTKCLTVTVPGLLELRRQLLEYARREGYTQVEIRGDRLTGANPNRPILYMRSLQ